MTPDAAARKVDPPLPGAAITQGTVIAELKD